MSGAPLCPYRVSLLLKIKQQLKREIYAAGRSDRPMKRHFIYSRLLDSKYGTVCIMRHCVPIGKSISVKYQVPAISS